MRLSPFYPLGWIFAGGLASANLFAHRFEEAIEWAEGALHQQPRWTPAIRSRLIACAHLGHTEEARDWLRRLLDIQTRFDNRGWRSSFGAAAFPPEILTFYMEGLRKAGLPKG
jgi:adenylate cyclase